ncbi:MAG: hypothetical protein AAGD04_03790 [Pseudomonadota bacterium]
MAYFDYTSTPAISAETFGVKRPNLRLMWRTLRTRRQLAQLDPARYEDLGLDADEVALELSRSIWDIAPR